MLCGRLGGEEALRCGAGAVDSGMREGDVTSTLVMRGSHLEAGRGGREAKLDSRQLGKDPEGRRS